MSELTTLFTNIANSIRAKEGTEETILASEFPTRISNLPSRGGTLNIFLQPDEPEIKKGVWIKTEDENDKIEGINIITRKRI